ncbi:MAG TPA: ATP-binding protein [Methanospirillum sp.]|nr:ATP-binding protein [Methanospirillum sp.]
MSPVRLPVGIQSFAEVITGGYAYVDKTPFLATLNDAGKFYFLSRPRRFGKSLLIDTLDCAFSGRRDLFSGLFLDTPESGWDWNSEYPVLRIDWSVSPVRTIEELKNRIHEILNSWAQTWGCLPPQTSIGGKFDYIVRTIQARTGKQVVVLIDEYDKPILDTLEDPIVAAGMRDLLRDFYSALKSLDPYLKFVMLTGVSKFVKTGIFSGLNNLDDITLDTRYSAICGYTQTDLETVFADRLAGFDSDQVRAWYNGYSWTGETVYNPFDILLLFSKGVFRPYWFESGTPTFLLKLWQNSPRLPAEYDGLIGGDDLLGSFDPECIRTETLLFQAGYLTIKTWSSDPVRGFRCVLGYPNIEVRTSLNILFSESLRGPGSTDTRDQLYDILEAGDTSRLRELIHSHFASIPYEWYRRNQISEFEGFYASIIYTWFASLGYEIIPEDMTNKGRIDLTVRTGTATWIFEFKVLGLDRSGDTSPLDQIRRRGYAEKYKADTRTIYEIGIVFDPESRNVERWEVGEGINGREGSRSK